MSRATRVAAVLVATTTLLAGRPAAAQRATESGGPAWMTAWSPLAAIADHPRELPRAHALPQLLLVPGPQVGLLWTAGNPAALPFEVSSRRNELRASGTWDDGSYRRPLDGDDVSLVQASGIGWQRLGRQGAVTGRVIADLETLGMSSFADVIEPHTSSPLVVADSSLPRMRRVRARLEGALGWRFGKWGLGLATGVEVRDHRTERARFPRLGRMSTQAVALGVMREIPFADLRLAAYGRWVGGTERITLVGQPATGLVYQLEGYSEPARREVVPPQVLYLRRIERDARSFGLALSGRLWGAAWTLFGERTSRDDGHSSAQRADPPTDRWKASGQVFGGAVQRALFGDRVLVTGELRYSQLEGEATRFDLEGDIFRAEESVLYGSADIRYALPGWNLAVIFSLGREERSGRDFIAEAGTQIESWRPGLGVEVARSLGKSTSVSVGYALSAYSAVSTIPNPTAMGPVYQQLIAPELSLYATQALPMTASIAVRRRIGEATALVLRGRRESLAARGSEPTLPFAPAGKRTLWSASLGIVMGQ